MARRPLKDVNQTAKSNEWSCYRNILALMRIGFSMTDIRYMTMSEFIAYTDLAFEKADDTREATQADIDRLLS